jgi:hypothetical protein
MKHEENRYLKYDTVHVVEGLPHEENCNYECGSLSGFESLMFGALEAHVLLSMPVLKFCVGFSS